MAIVDHKHLPLGFKLSESRLIQRGFDAQFATGLFKMTPLCARIQVYMKQERVEKQERVAIRKAMRDKLLRRDTGSGTKSCQFSLHRIYFHKNPA